MSLLNDKNEQASIQQCGWYVQLAGALLEDLRLGPQEINNKLSAGIQVECIEFSNKSASVFWHA